VKRSDAPKGLKARPPRADARGRLLAHVDGRVEGMYEHPVSVAWRAKTRRLLAAVLREYGECMGHLDNLKFAVAMKVAGIDEATSRRVFAAIDATGLRAGRKSGGRK
jgi:hypothetical protein